MTFLVSDEVAGALAAGRPVVALETAVLTHGLPSPQNLAVAHAMSAALREAGATPAPIGVFGGALRVGLSDAQLEAMAADEDRRKCSPRDLAAAVLSGSAGGTTVAATMAAAARAGIRVFATGGIGGVHRGDPVDVSADLPALGRHPMVVVCSGPKSLLDLPRTLEVLETQGVALLGWRCDRMPAFYVLDSGLPITARVDAADEVASFAAARDAIGLPASLLVTVPPPAGSALSAEEVDAVVADVQEEAEASGVRGAALTPFVLTRMAERTGGRSMTVNLALLERNAAVAGRIGLAMCALESGRGLPSD